MRSIGETGGAGKIVIRNHRSSNELSIYFRLQPLQFVQVAVE